MKQQLCAKKNLLVAKDSVFSVGLKKAAETTSLEAETKMTIDCAPLQVALVTVWRGSPRDLFACKGEIRLTLLEG